MSQTAKAQEPSMEDILASIRRIIADDEGKGRGAEPARPAPAASPRPAAAPAPAPVRVSSPPPRPATAAQDEIDAMLSGIDAPPPKGNGRAGADGPAADVLDLTESMTAASAQPPVFRTVEAQSDVFFSEEPDEPPALEPPALRSMEEPRRPAPAEAQLISSSTSAAVDTAFNMLAHTVLSQNARTLEDLVKEMMRPMLKAWLDDNLPGLVERVVRAEIERVSRGRNG